MVQHACPNGYFDASKYSSPLPIIGIYIAAASILCFLGIAIDTFRGFWHRKPWFPCKYYSLNAATLTILGVATKLPVDLSSLMPSRQDQLTKLTGSIMICVSMGFFMPSLGYMTRNELLSNLVAMSTLAITMVVNICIQMGTGLIYVYFVEHVIILACILSVLVILWFSSISHVISYREVFDLAYQADARSDSSSLTFKEIRERLENVWKIAHVGNPQYALGRSSNGIAVSILCAISMAVLLQALLRSFMLDNFSFCHGVSDYRFSTWVVLVAQISAIITAGVATTTRWFVLAFRASPKRFRTWRDLLKVEDYYHRWLRGLKNQHLIPSYNGFLRRMLRRLIKIMVDLLIVSQKGVVMTGKFMCFSSVWCAFLFKKFLFCLGCISDEEDCVHSNTMTVVEDLSKILGEMDLVPSLLKDSMRDMARWENKCQESVPSPLNQLLSKWHTTGTFDLENPCSLDLVLLVNIAMLLSPSNGERSQLLVNAVNEGLEIVHFVEQNSGRPKGLFSSKLSLYIWSTRNDPDHWLNKGFRRLSAELKSIDTIQVQVILEKIIKFCTESSNPSYFDNLEAECLQDLFAKSKRPFKSLSNLIDFLEETACEIIHDLLKSLPRAIIEEFTHYPMENHEERVRRAMYFLFKAQKLQDQITFIWQEI